MKTTRVLSALLATALLARTDVLPPSQDTSSLKGKLTAATGKATTLAIAPGTLPRWRGSPPTPQAQSDRLLAACRTFRPRLRDIAG